MILVVMAAVLWSGAAPLAPGASYAAGATPDLRINEILADPASGPEGDANGDGVRHTYDDEFVEIVNVGSVAVDLAGWSLRDSTDVRHVFADTVSLRLEPGEFLTIFGGGDPTGIGGIVVTASEGSLSLNNGGDRVTILTPGGDVADTHGFGSEGGRDLSMVRLPDGSGSWFLAGDEGSLAPFSPGASNGFTAPVQHGSWGSLKARLAAP